MSEKDDYFNYVANVLGIKSLYIENSTAEMSDVSVPLLIRVEGLSTYSAEESDLLQRMVTALKIDLGRIKIVDAQTTFNSSADFVLDFTDSGTTSLEKTNHYLSTISPRTLVKNSALKKQTWNDLQKIIQFFT